MSSIIELWREKKEIINNKKVDQIIGFIGNGKLTDLSQTSKEFRELLNVIPTDLLLAWTNECLEEKFNSSGFVFQDIINQIGIRLGFNVEYGVYRGSKNRIGCDGIWKTSEGFSIIVEVKTTDVYRINLDIISNYRKNLSEKKQVIMEQSSMLIVVGRQDTGDLEAQIRGSRHAWDIRLISAGSLSNLLILKEKLNDAKTSMQINSILKPMEYTKLDKLTSLIFTTARDLEIEDIVENNLTEINENNKLVGRNRNIPVNFHSECVVKIEDKLKLIFHKQSKTSYLSDSKEVCFTLAVSKTYPGGAHDAKYWFAFHPHQKDFLENTESAFVAFGCGSSKNLFLINYNDFRSLIDYMWTTEKENRMYWHIVIYKDEDNFILQVPKKREFKSIDNFKV